MIYIYSLFHILFIFGIFFLWRLIDKKLDYKRYIKITFIVGILCASLYDLVGVVLLKFWIYSIDNVFEYIVISFSTYIIATPLFLEVFDYLIFKLSKFKLNFKIEVSKAIKILLSILFSLIGLSILLLKIFEYIQPNWIFFIVSSIVFLIVVDLFVNIVTNINGPVIRFLNGEILSPISLILSGFIGGFLWELFNTYMPLWRYINLPSESILNIPLVVVIFWGILIYGYWALSQILVKDYKLRSH